MEHPRAPLTRSGIVQRTGTGWQLTTGGEARYGWALRELDERCHEFEAAGCRHPEWSITLMLIEAGQQAARDSE
jgi:hypothetical protein